MIYRIEELESFIKQEGIDPQDICIVGSAIFSVLGIRANNDLEIILKPLPRRKVTKKYRIRLCYWDHKEFLDGIDVFRNMYGVVGYTDRRIFKEGLYEIVDGRLVVSLEMEYLYKQFLTRHMPRQKDVKDIEASEQLLNHKKLAHLKRRANWFVSFFSAALFDAGVWRGRLSRLLTKIGIRRKKRGEDLSK